MSGNDNYTTLEKTIIEEMISYIEEKEEHLDVNSGSYSGLQKLIDENKMPPLYYHLKELIN